MERLNAAERIFDRLPVLVARPQITDFPRIAAGGVSPWAVLSCSEWSKVKQDHESIFGDYAQLVGRSDASPVLLSDVAPPGGRDRG